LKSIFLKLKIIEICFFFYIFFLFLFLFGIEFINPVNTLWLYTKPDIATAQTGWVFFKNDIWRFPFGSNPNYGHSFGNSIVYSDSIPILAILFKLFFFLIKIDYQYFGLWFLACFYLHFLFSFKLIKLFTKNNYFSFLSANFFLLSPILLVRFAEHVSYFGHWILLWFLYLLFKYKFNLGINKILIILTLSVSIALYFTAIISIAIFFLFLFQFFLKNQKKMKLIKGYLFIYFVTFLLMYLIGYFEINALHAAAGGLGIFNLNLLGIFNSFDNNTNWSFFFKDLNFNQNIENFNYLGLGYFILILISFFAYLKNINFFLLKLNEKFTQYLIIILLFLFFFSLSNKIYFGDLLLFEFKLNKYIEGFISIFRATSRFFWLVNYLILTITLVILFCFYKKKILILLTLLIIQITDIYIGIKTLNYNQLPKVFFSEKLELIFKNYEIFYSSLTVNYHPNLVKFAPYFEKFKTKKTNIINLARYDREKMYSFIQDFNERLLNKKINYNEIIQIENIQHLKNLKNIFNLNEYIFIYRENFWFVAKKNQQIKEQKNKNFMSIQDYKSLDKIKLDKILFNQEIYFDLVYPKYIGIGWQKKQVNKHIENKIWSNDKFKIKINYNGYVKQENYSFFVDMYINEKYYKKILINDENEKAITLDIDPTILKSQDLNITFKFKGVKSPWLQSKIPNFANIGISVNKYTAEKVQ